MTDLLDEFPELRLLPVGEQAFQAICAMDPAEQPRAELRASGISEHRIRALYPLDFFDLAPRLREHLLPQDLDYLIPFSTQMQSMIATVEVVVARDLDADLKSRWHAEHPMERAATTEQLQLEEVLYEKFGADDRARSLAYRFMSVLWNGWWFSHNQHLLRGDALVANSIINAVGSSYLPSLLVKQRGSTSSQS